jgi:hypothetical protein
VVEIPKDLFTPESILTLTGATGATYVVCAGLQQALNFNPKWLALAIAQVLALAGTYATQPQDLVHYLIAIVNGFLIYCTALGVNSTLAPPSSGGPVSKGFTVPSAPPTQRGFLTRWV